MKRITVLTAILCLCFQTIAVLAATPDYSGEWELDVAKSTLPNPSKVESMTLKVSQTEKDLTVESAIKFAPRPVGDNGGTTPDGNRGGRAMGMGFASGSNGINTYSLEGKEITTDINRGTMTGKVFRRATVATDGKLSLTATSNINSEMGSITMKVNETWELLDGGKTLKITRYTETPRGGMNSEMYFTKKSSGATVAPTIEYQGRATTDENHKPKQINGGVLNVKALELVKPEYPANARFERASGAVNVQVTIDEKGNIISATAVSGHPKLRRAAEEAALKCKFAPTLLEGKPVKITGIIVYNFVP